MAELLIEVGGRGYRLACGDGEEEALRAAARHLDRHASSVTERLGAVSEVRLLLMAALLTASEHLETKPAPQAHPALEALAARAEALAQALEQGLEEAADKP
jgi:cell division protein ZapA